MDKTTIYLPCALHADLKAIARRTGRPQAAIIREALATYVAQQEWPLPKSWGIAANGEINAADIDDWLAENWKPDW